MNQPPLPVTVLSGFLGAGKSTVLDHLAGHGEGLRIATIPAALASSDALLAELQRLAAAEERYDAVLIEAPGIADPMTFAEAFAFVDEDGASLADFARLDTMVTVVDAANFLRDFGLAETLQERGVASAAADDDRTVVEVLIEQIEFCDVIVLNKVDQIGATDGERLKRILQRLNPRAVQIEASFGAVPRGAVLDTGLFDFDATAAAPGWLAALDNQEEHTADTDEFGVGTVVYRARRPFHPERFWALLHEEWPGVLRGKGFFWLATRNDFGGSLSQAGGACRPGPAGTWWAAQDRSEWPDGDPELEAEIAADWYGAPDDTSIGDRRQELVLIGTDLDAHAWRAKFDACLLTDAEWALGPAEWSTFADPFPLWELEEHEHDHDHDHGDDCDCGDSAHHHDHPNHHH